MAVVSGRAIFDEAGLIPFEAKAHAVFPSIAELVHPDGAHAFVYEPPI